MVFTGTDRTTCPNYNEATDELDMSYQASFMDSTIMSDPQYGNENFNRTCFNICATKNEEPTYIMNGRCNTCEPNDEGGSPNDPRIGTKDYLIDAGLYQMCNVDGDENNFN